MESLGNARNLSEREQLRKQAMSLRPILLPYQRDFVADAHRVKVAVKSRRVGFTFAVAAEAAFVAAGPKNAGGMDVWYMHLAQRDTRDFIAVAARWAKHLEQAMVAIGNTRAAAAFELEDGVLETEGAGGRLTIPGAQESPLLYRDSKNNIRSVMVTSIRFKSGHKVTGIPKDPNVLRGKDGYAIFDEAALLPLDECFAAASAFFMSMGTPGRMSFISTQRGQNNPFNKLVMSISEGRAEAGTSLHRVTLPEAVDQGFYARDCFLRGKPWSQEEEDAWLSTLLESPSAAQEYLCLPARDGETYFLRELLVRSTTPHAIRVRWALPEGWGMQRNLADMLREGEQWFNDNVLQLAKTLSRGEEYTLGIDYGRSPKGDLEAIAVTGHKSSRDGDVTRTRHRTHFILELYGVPQPVQELLVELLGSSVPNLVAAATDAGGNGAALAEFSVHRFAGIFEALHLTQSWYELYVPSFRGEMQAGLIEIPDYEDLIDDFQMFEYVDGIPRIPKRRRTSDAGKRHGDAALAVIISYYAWINGSSGGGEPFSVPFTGLAPAGGLF